MWEAMWGVYRQWTFVYPHAPAHPTAFVTELKPRSAWINLLSQGQARQCSHALASIFEERLPKSLLTDPGATENQHIMFPLAWLQVEGGGHPDVYALYLSAWVESLIDAIQARESTALRHGQLVSFRASLGHLHEAMNKRLSLPPQSPTRLNEIQDEVARLIEEYEYKSDPEIS